MNDLIFSLNATIPVFLLMVLGYIFKKIGWIDEIFASKMSNFVFRVSLPLLVFKDLVAVDMRVLWDTKFVVFCVCATVLSILLTFILSFLLKDKSIQGEFVQASYRSSAAILGVALIQNIYGSTGMGPLMLLTSVPIYNIMAVIILTIMKPGQNKLNRKVLKEAAKGIITNPFVIMITAGILWSVLEIPMSDIAWKTLNNVSSVATPMGLMAMGAGFEFKKAFGKLKPAMAAVFIKLVGFCAIFLPVAVKIGFREDALIAILVMLGSSSTVACYVMAKSMGHEGTLTSSVVMLTTVFAAFTLTMWVYILKSMGLV